jgi:hypothetical protein
MDADGWALIVAGALYELVFFRFIATVPKQVHVTLDRRLTKRLERQKS